jgi:hypothetical protein
MFDTPPVRVMPVFNLELLALRTAVDGANQQPLAITTNAAAHT